MKRFVCAAVAAAFLAAGGGTAAAEDRMIAGNKENLELVQEGTEELITTPAPVFTETQEDFNNFGAAAIVTGPVTGGVKSVGRGLTGAGKMAIGIMDILTRPIRESNYNRSGPGALR
ncbi:MAG: hypothetical protein ACU85V_18680 [Gammaproteobacteria bacterium]